MLLMVEKGIRERVCHAIHWYAKANNKYMKYYDKTKASSYLKYWGVNNLYGWAMLQKLPVNNLKWIEDLSKFDEGFIKSFNEKSKKGYFPKVHAEYPKKLHELHNDLPFLPERMNIEKVEKLVANLHDNNKYVIPIRNLKQALNHQLVLKKVDRAIKFNQKTWLKSYIEMNTELRKKEKNYSEKYFFKLINNPGFGNKNT